MLSTAFNPVIYGVEYNVGFSETWEECCQVVKAGTVTEINYSIFYYRFSVVRSCFEWEPSIWTSQLLFTQY